MNTDKIYAESIANEYAKKDEKKVVALKKLDKKAKRPSNIDESNRRRLDFDHGGRYRRRACGYRDGERKLPYLQKIA